MRKTIILLSIIFVSLCLTGCGKGKVKINSDEINKINLTSDQVTLEVYYHQVLEWPKKAQHFLEKDRLLFAEYDAIVKFGIDLSEVKIALKNDQLNVTIPKGKIIDGPNVDLEDFEENKFLESKEGINPNKITNNEILNEAMEIAKNDLRKKADADENLKKLAQERSKVIIENKIKEKLELTESQYTINWSLEK